MSTPKFKKGQVANSGGNNANKERQPRKYSYDQRCAELAEHFLDDSASNQQIAELAQHIQNAIENYLEGERDA